MKRRSFALALCAALLTPTAHAASLSVADTTLDYAACRVVENTTYVPVRAVAQALRPAAQVSWTGEAAMVRDDGLVLVARPGDDYMVCNGSYYYVPSGVLLDSGSTLVPARTLAAALGAGVDWNAATGAVTLTAARDVPTADQDPDSLYWLSRIISAESRGEPMAGKIAVGNVVLNRVASTQFPDTIYGVIFDERWGGQFEPVRNGTVFDDPTEESVTAARLCLSGANTVGQSLYFLAPALTDDHWTMDNRTYVATIGAHWFYL